MNAFGYSYSSSDDIEQHMRFLFDIGHPGHVHLFKNLANRLLTEGHDLLFTCRQKEFEIELLEAAGLPYLSFGKHYKTLPGKIWGLIRFDFQMVRAARQFQPDVLISHGSIYAAHAAWFIGKPHLSLEDSGNMEQIRLYRPCTDVILTPDILPEDLGSKQIRYAGYHELAYLHPNVFRPDEAVYQWLGLATGAPFAIIRFVSWNATHDAGHRGLSNTDKLALVEKLANRMPVFISSEAPLDKSLQPYLFKLPPEQLHHALSAARIVISEGATIASEAGVLGTPTIYINTIARSYCQEQEQYGLIFNTAESEKVFDLVDQILATDRSVYQQRQKALLANKVDVTAYLYDFIRNRYLNKRRKQNEKISVNPNALGTD